MRDDALVHAARQAALAQDVTNPVEETAAIPGLVTQPGPVSQHLRDGLDGGPAGAEQLRLVLVNQGAVEDVEELAADPDFGMRREAAGKSRAVRRQRQIGIQHAAPAALAYLNREIRKG